MLNNLGPAGAIVCVISLIAFLVGATPASPSAREEGDAGGAPTRLLLALPLISVVFLGVSRIQYPADRFYTIVCVALFPLVAAGLTNVIRTRVAIAALTLAAIINLAFVTFIWPRLYSTFEYVAERHAVAHASKSDSLYLLSTHKRNADSSRLDYLGYRADPRAIQEIAATRRDLPQWIYATQGDLQFLEDARKLPARAEMMRKESGFDVSQWHGFEGLGYQLNETITPRTPQWFCFDWMPAIHEWQKRHTVFVYRRQ
jgi:hypothetical protein